MCFSIWLCIAPMMIYPRKQLPPANFREGAIAHTLFVNSSNGWINSDLFLQWFGFFLQHIPPTRPVLLIMDGHGSHMSIDLIELAQSNGVHILCLPSHTTHVLQPLDVGFCHLRAIFQRHAANTLLLTQEE